MFADFLTAGTYFLRKYRSVINDLNVFPVPDGDTGTNMFLTVRSAMIEARKTSTAPLSAVAAAAAHGSLMGARGNSGVIISQMFRGFAHAVRHRSSMTTSQFATALSDGVRAARQALLKPVEGTMLSVASAAAKAAFTGSLHERDFYALLHEVVSAANEALEKTPEQLDTLREAGVVDAGGQGFVYFMEGVIRMLPGRAPYTTAFPRGPVRRSRAATRQKIGRYRYCTEFMLAGARNGDALKAALVAVGDSVIVAGDAAALRVHVHTDRPTEVFALAQSYGDVSKRKVDDMQKQHDLLVAATQSKAAGIVCLVPGEGFAKICKELGADVTLLAGATMNPSVKDLLVAVNAAVAPIVIVLPNDKNALLATSQLQHLTDKRVVIIPTTSVVRGIAALFSLLNRADEGPVSAERALADASSVVGASIFRAGRSVALRGALVQRGELLGSLDGQDGKRPALVHGKNAETIAVSLVRQAADAEASLVTVYYGDRVAGKEPDRVADALRAAFPHTAVEVYYGGQSSSDYLISIER
ncbi:MAG: DAK2 domain-containing protein [Candidatus Eremiobacter antarcticus]|nr:DAK2 domain-containing protein [Candidatus Eremiobacteraeota bacterium]MBC5808658.1 DAK2 domain-containing protein [Candidatus Eremiobacteraeota bacterium]